ncbi:hypothetical protein K4K48_009622 [Colletotrichum sp. SAR 10_66]|nr:hypothetical protein K4K48_009622 [Colletotrichum sp. SAR 10_66]
MENGQRPLVVGIDGGTVCRLECHKCDDAGQTPEKDVDAESFKIANPENMMEEFCSPPTSDTDYDQLLRGLFSYDSSGVI